MSKVIIIGGGLAGLVCSIKLVDAGISCTVVEKKLYPLHRVCGEYVSNEARPFLKAVGIFPEEFSPPTIDTLELSSVTGKNSIIKLEMGGFGISRYIFDNYLYETAKAKGVEFMLNTEAKNVSFHSDKFLVELHNKHLESEIVIGAFGKRSKLDITLNRNFIQKRSPYVGVKYHAYSDHQSKFISLHNFEKGYCGINNIENGKTNICYLTHRDQIKRFGDIESMEENVLYKNPLLKNLFCNAQFLFEKPEVINEISFETKSPIENHMLMIGDAAGMIAPLCGNGMAMAIHSAKVASECVIDFFKHRKRELLEKTYAKEWNKQFSNRLAIGRAIQNLFGNAYTSNFVVNLMLYSQPLSKAIIKRTHGKIF